MVCGLYFVFLHWVQYTTALGAFPGVNTVVSHPSSNVAKGAVKGFKSSITHTRGIVLHPITVFGTLERHERTWPLST